MFQSPIDEIFPNPPEGLDACALVEERVPRHVAVIMDGNGRWAHSRGLSRKEGHIAGVEAVRELITSCSDVGVRYLTIYSFSTENWQRPKDEVNGLMGLFATTLLKELAGLRSHGVKICVLGDMGRLPAHTRSVFKRGVSETCDDVGMTLSLAVNYGGRQEILRSVREIARRVKAGRLDPDKVDCCDIEEGLYTFGMPDPDLVIRTSGEMRLSNFLLWQVAYSEFYVTDLLWPEFTRYDLLRALLDFQARERRFGGVRDDR